MEMAQSANVLLVAMPFAGVHIPSIQLPLLAGYLRKHHVAVDEAHLYVQAANIYGVLGYTGLIAPPNDSYTAQLSFVPYVFPQHWENIKNDCETFFEKHTTHLKDGPMDLSFDEYLARTDTFYHWVLQNIDWKSYDLIGFTLNYGQFLPSLAIAKHIKEHYPEKRIVFGGSRTTGEIGKHVLEVFEYVDYIVSGEGEEALLQLSVHPDQYQHIPHLLYRTPQGVHWNTSEQSIDINALSFSSYDPFFAQLHLCSSEVQQYYQFQGRLPVEISRGCWWNKCSFCNLNIQHTCYREKNVERIIEEIIFLSEQYKTVSFELIGNTLPKNAYRSLCHGLKTRGRDLFFFVESRAGQMNQDDYALLAEAGFTTIQTGIESFSSHYLQTMNKGTCVIDNIAVLKYCKEHGIQNSYNLLVNYPNEEAIDFEQTKNTVQLLQEYLDPPSLCQLRVMYGSSIYCHPEQYTIKSLQPASIDQLLFPPDILEKNISFAYDFITSTQPPEHNWDELVQHWKDIRNQRILEAVQQPTLLNQYVYYYVDGGTFIKIYDKRNPLHVQIFTLNTEERKVFLCCLDVVSFSQLQQQLPEIPEYQLAAILHSFEKNGIVFREDTRYLSLPLTVHPYTHKKTIVEKHKNDTLLELLSV